METPLVAQLVLDLLLVLSAGLAAGVICKRFGLSVLTGYLIVGALIGQGGSGLVTEQRHYELSSLAEAGALLLLFSIGIEFSLQELLRLSRYFFVGGPVQMALSAAPVTAAGMMLGLSWRPAVLIGAAAALSSTVLVYKALEEYGQTATAHGRRAIAILLFQDVLLAPLVLLIPLLTHTGAEPTVATWGFLAAKSLLFVVAVLLLRRIVNMWLVPALAALRSTELVVLFAITMLGGAGLGAYSLGLPPALGAFAAGLALNGNRLTGQIDALVLPYRETFAAVFFVSLGTLMRFDVLWQHPLLCFGGLAGVLLVKAAAGTVALRAVGLPWRVAGGMGLGLAQLGEFSFLLLAAGLAAKLIEPLHFQVALALALGTLILTPQLIKTGLRWADTSLDMELDGGPPEGPALPAVRHAVIIGLGPIGTQVASRLETSGIDVCLVDLSPVNLHPYAQEGFHTVAGDATDRHVLGRAGIAQVKLAVVAVPKDQTSQQIVRAIRRLNAGCAILVRCRYQSSVAAVKKAGATAVVSEEAEASAGLLRLLERVELGL
jgi:CPA2 family monovalent cation:H+ antiporter-2